jgi:hypothetical protein
MLTKRQCLAIAVVLLALLLSCVPFGLNATPAPEADAPPFITLASAITAVESVRLPAGCDWWPIRYSVTSTCCAYTRYGGYRCTRHYFTRPCPYCYVSDCWVGHLKHCSVTDNDTGRVIKSW